MRNKYQMHDNLSSNMSNEGGGKSQSNNVETVKEQKMQTTQYLFVECCAVSGGLTDISE